MGLIFFSLFFFPAGIFPSFSAPQHQPSFCDSYVQQSGLSIGYEVGGDILKVDGTGSRRPPYGTGARPGGRRGPQRGTGAEPSLGSKGRSPRKQI